MKKRTKIQESTNAMIDYVMTMNNVSKIDTNKLKFNRLLSCSASVADFNNVKILKSYSTEIAYLIYFENQTYCIDVLRKVYGYTNTSAKHISKFIKLYAPKDCIYLTWR